MDHLTMETFIAVCYGMAALTMPLWLLLVLGGIGEWWERRKNRRWR